ncbi:13845_t:CDS:2 [Gigaspora rosea]|nr:13845_t:CDS:2 [Gigaspora rosea]
MEIPRRPTRRIPGCRKFLAQNFPDDNTDATMTEQLDITNEKQETETGTSHEHEHS